MAAICLLQCSLGKEVRFARCKSLRDSVRSALGPARLHWYDRTIICGGLEDEPALLGVPGHTARVVFLGATIRPGRIGYIAVVVPVGSPEGPGTAGRGRTILVAIISRERLPRMTEMRFHIGVQRIGKVTMVTSRVETVGITFISYPEVIKLSPIYSTVPIFSLNT